MIDPGTAQHSLNAGRSPEKLCLRQLAASANPCSGPFGLAWRAATEQGRLRKPASGESRLISHRLAVVGGFRPAEARMPLFQLPRLGKGISNAYSKGPAGLLRIHRCLALRER